MTFADQITVAQKWTSNYDSVFEDQIKNTLNAEYLHYTKAFPNIVTSRTGTFTTVADQLDQQVGTDVGKKCVLVAEYPDFHAVSGAPQILTPVRYDDEGYLLVNFQEKPDDEHEISYDYRLRITALTDESASMSVDADAQLAIAHRAARKLVTFNVQAFHQF